MLALGPFECQHGEDGEGLPTYEYACRQCGTHLDVVQRFTDDALTTCPSCGGSLRKVFGSIGISFKGSGFYKNDSRSPENGKTDKTEKTEKTDKEVAAKTESPSKAGDGGSSDGSKSPPAPRPDKPKADAPKAAS